ncbi:MAG: DUF4199 domain-containing protein [Dyadobacter sp.]|uniref:DUF4199 domain-containing protein n=1 Tax=Dyadobacter sp. TaxID=1914288 RepID=UPI0032654566
MKRIVTICGLIAGVIVSTFMVSSIAVCYNKESFEGNMLLGYASMLLAFSLVFVGIKNYRDKHNGGFVTFGKAFTIGLYISLIASTVYVIVWLFDYYLFIPDFMEKFTASTIKKLQEDGVSGAELESQIAEMGTYKELYKNPFGVVLLTYVEILPVGLVVSLISALILKRNGAVRNT